LRGGGIVGEGASYARKRVVDEAFLPWRAVAPAIAEVPSCPSRAAPAVDPAAL